MNLSFAHAGEGNETHGLVEGPGVGFGVRDDPDAAEAIALFERQSQDVSQERLADSKSLDSTVDSKAGEAEHGQRVGREALPETGDGEALALDRAGGDRGESDDPPIQRRNVGHGQMELELILSRVVLEEAVQVRLPARETASVVLRAERPDVNAVGHA